MSLTAANAFGLSLPAAEEIIHLVSSDGPEPTAECIARTFPAKTVEVSRDGLKNVLKNISGILGLESPGSTPGKHEGGIECNHTFPGSLIARPSSFEQAPVGASGRGFPLIALIDGS
jgi:hypothetical protein